MEKHRLAVDGLPFRLAVPPVPFSHPLHADQMKSGAASAPTIHAGEASFSGGFLFEECHGPPLRPPPKPKSPILTVGQKRRRIERLQKCVTDLEAFDPLKVRKRAPAVIELEAVIDKALSSAFGYGTPAAFGCCRCTRRKSNGG